VTSSPRGERARIERQRREGAVRRAASQDGDVGVLARRDQRHVERRLETV
jgi:hypothetical protein